MENYPLMIRLACAIIVGGYAGFMISAIILWVKEFVTRHRKKKEDKANDLHQ